MSGLPEALRSAVQSLLEGRSRRALALRARIASAGYRAGSASAGLIRDDVDVAAYLTVRMPATFAAVAAAIREVEGVVPDYAPRSVLDVACGPGTAAFACTEAWPSIEQVTMVDANPLFVAAARTLATGADKAAVRAATIRHGRAELAATALPEADLVVLAYALVEVSETVACELTARLWARCTGMLLLVEPGSRDGFGRLRRCRDVLLDAGARVLAPCPHDSTCPMADPDWCHFSERLPRSRDHMIAKVATVPFEDEKFSYLAVARGTPARRPAGRLLSPPKLSKAHWSGRVCVGGTVCMLGVERRDPRYRRLAKSRWGDAVDSDDLNRGKERSF